MIMALDTIGAQRCDYKTRIRRYAPCGPPLGLSSCLVVAFLSGCALSPQTVRLAPVIDVAPRNIGSERQLAIEVIDARSRREFGARGGVYGDSSMLLPSNEITSPIRQALVSALLDYRFRVAQPGIELPLKLTVTVEDIRYTPSGSPLVRAVKTELRLRVQARNGARDYATEYTASTTREVLSAPSPEENERIINRVVSKGLERLLTDEQLLEFLRASG